jgi:hypothetical protein
MNDVFWYRAYVYCCRVRKFIAHMNTLYMCPLAVTVDTGLVSKVTKTCNVKVIIKLVSNLVLYL